MKFNHKRRRRLTFAENETCNTISENFDNDISYDDIFTISNAPYESMVSLIIKHKNAIMILNKENEIINVNEEWENLCQYRRYEVVGKTPKFLQGKNTDMSKLRNFTEKLHTTGTSQVIVCNYKKDKSIFFNKIDAYKIRDTYDYHYLDSKNRPFFIAELTEVL